MLISVDEVFDQIVQMNSGVQFHWNPETRVLSVSEKVEDPNQYSFIWDRPITQKARGIKALNNPTVIQWLKGYGIRVNPIIVVLGEETQFSKLEAQKWFYTTTSVFGRPCPTVPTHGFVDSRPVKNYEQVKSLLEETLSHDKYGEVILQPTIQASHNVIVANNQLIIGPDNDGATAGKKSLTFNMPSKMIDELKRKLEALDNKLVGADEDFYFEFVIQSTQSYIVQARSGPKLGITSNDFIPADMVVTNVIKATGDLIEWKKTCEKLKGKTGVVVNHCGGNTSSHYFIHCYTNNIPVVTTFVPKVGDKLIQTANNKLEFPDFFRGFAMSFTQKPDESYNTNVNQMGAHPYFSRLLRCSIAVFHSLAHQRDSFVIGAALGTFCRIGLMLCCGEARYCLNSEKKLPEFISKSRNEVYKDTYDCDANIISLGQKSWWLFKNTQFPGGCGGNAWATSTKIFLDILGAVYNGDMSDAIGMWNVAVNAAHNNGWLFNKLMSKSEFDTASNDPLHYIFKQNIIGTFYSLFASFKNNPTDTFELPDLELVDPMKAASMKAGFTAVDGLKVARVQVRKTGMSTVRVQVRYKVGSSQYKYTEKDMSIDLYLIEQLVLEDAKYKSMAGTSAMYVRLTKSVKEGGYALKNGTQLFTLAEIEGIIMGTSPEEDETIF